MRDIFTFLAGLVGYLLGAYLGTYFSLPPGFASVIWPATGITLALYLRYGHTALFGAFVGSLMTNFGIGSTESFINAEYIAPILISVATMSQVFVGASLAKRLSKDGFEFNSGREIFGFFVLAGPISCVIAPSVGTYFVANQVQLNANDSMFTWLKWWIGDSIGVIFFAPLLLTVTGYIKSPLHPRNLQVAIPCLLMFLLITVAFNVSKSYFFSEQTDRFEGRAQQYSQKMSEEFRKITGSLNALSAFFKSTPHIERDSFKNYTQTVLSNNKYFESFAWLPKTSIFFKDEVEDQANLEGVKGFKVHSYRNNGKSDLIPWNDNLYPVVYFEDRNDLRDILGLNLSSVLEFRRLVEQVVTRDTLIAKDNLELKGINPARLFSVVTLPFYKRDGVYVEPVNREERKQYLYGILLVAVDLKSLLNEAIGSKDLVELRVFGGAGKANIEDTNQLKQRQFSQLTSIKILEWYDNEIEVEFVDLDRNIQKDWRSWMTLVVGFIFASMGLAFILVVSGFSANLAKQVKLKTKQLEQAKEFAEESNVQKSMFIKTLSREIRTPLQAVVGYAGVGIEIAKSNKTKEYLEKISGSSQLLLRVVDDLLDISRMERGEIEIRHENFNLNNLVQRISSTIEKLAQDKGLEFKIKFTGKFQAVLQGDADRVEQVLLNLCSNAVKFTESGQVTLLVELGEVKVQQLNIIFKICDTGIGVGTDKAVQINQLFSASQEQLKLGRYGVGAGLMVVTKLVKAMSGTVSFTSKEQEGSIFVVSLPFEVGENTSSSASSSKSDISDSRVLVVEDNQLTQELLSEMFTNIGVVPRIAGNGEEALELIDEEGLMDLVFTDIEMPGIDGLTLMKRIRSMKGGEGAVIYAMSANAMPEDIEQGLNAGFTGYITKPVKFDKLKQIVHSILK